MNDKQLKEIEQELDVLEAWKKYVIGMMKGGKAKKSLALWQTADKKAVLPVFQLRTDEYEGRKYQTIAWPIATRYDVEAAKKLLAAVELGTIRYHTKGVSDMLRPARTEKYHPEPEITAVNKFGLSAVCLSDQNHYDATIWMTKDGEEYYLPFALK